MREPGMTTRSLEFSRNAQSLGVAVVSSGGRPIQYGLTEVASHFRATAPLTFGSYWAQLVTTFTPLARRGAD